MSNPEKLIELGQLILEFARVERATYHEDGKRKETDTDHTVMLGVMGCNLASKLYPNLDLGRVAQYALVHDLVEVYAGDTSSFKISAKEKLKKSEREKESLIKIQKNFPDFPWLIKTIERYENLHDKEARFVKSLDKFLPKITHILNKGVYFKEIGAGKEELLAFHEEQHRTLSETYAKEFPELMVIMKSLMDMVDKECFPSNT